MVNRLGVINFRISDEMKQKVERLAEKLEISEGAVCRMALSKHLEKEDD